MAARSVVGRSRGIPGVLLRLLPFLRPYWLRVLEAFFCMVFTTLLALPMPLLSVYIIDQIIANHQMTILHIVCGALALAVVLGSGLGYLQRYLVLVFSRRVFFDLEIRLFKTVHSLPLPFFQQSGSGYLATRISDDVRQLRSLMAGTYIEGLTSLALVTGALASCLPFTHLSRSPRLLYCPHSPGSAFASVVECRWRASLYRSERV